ncbi:hypothetical protein Psch_03124 [Pelotomaculum schinkii]|uniref:TIGR04076 family protein n=1 Tax=Pelotomaculum schinkii TaxID=78350 RepID=A0A4Y7RB80_9FIRM|nr:MULTISPECIES: TIGR04076 family protein [Pelotomaculum]TEB06082.1 hypothetical protein Psch_03124 [Pelotomaculum schinkii]TEB10141.1 hypothetical protein Psfp_04207 [Pelotomaculum sp. FP]
MTMFAEQKIRIEVLQSQCKLYQPGDCITIDGPMIDFDRTDRVCVTALHAIYPFIFAMRKGVSPEAMGFDGKVTVQCPDYCAPVIFTVSPFTE